MRVHLVLPFPASIRSKKKTRQAVVDHVQRACKPFFIGALWEGTCEMTFFGQWRHANGKRKRRDAHNYAMVLIDLLQGFLGMDDSQVIHFLIHKRPSQDREYVSVTFT